LIFLSACKKGKEKPAGNGFQLKCLNPAGLTLLKKPVSNT